MSNREADDTDMKFGVEKPKALPSRHVHHAQSRDDKQYVESKMTLNC